MSNSSTRQLHRFSGGPLRKRRNPEQEERDTLFSVFASEFLIHALLSTVATSILAAAKDGRCVQTLGPVSGYLPGKPTIYPGSMANLAALGVPAPILRSIQNFYTRCDLAKSASAHIFNDLETHVSTQSADIPQSYDLWMTVCGAAILSIHFLNGEEIFAEGELQSMTSLVHSTIARFRRNEIPFVRSNGTLFIPGWLEFRRSDRQTVKQSVTIRYGGHVYNGQILDISRTGMGLATSARMQVGDEFVACRPDGQLFRATVVWVTKDRYGAVFPAPIDIE